MSNEIKVGDKVRVRKDAPRVYLRDWCKAVEYDVYAVDGDAAIITYGYQEIAIPLKYLVKVEDEAFRLADVVSDAGLHQDNYLNEDKKEAKIKLGDMVRVKENLHEPFCLNGERHLEFHNIHPHAVSQKEWEVVEVESRRDCAEHIYTLKHGDSFIYNIPEDCVELVKPTEQAEAKEAARIRLMEVELDEFRKEEIDRVLHPEKYYTYEVTIDNVAMNWQLYEADLAKEVALKVANKFNAPHEAAEYAVSVAKAVVEELKRK